jgi:CheY-like chemotaxis protein
MSKSLLVVDDSPAIHKVIRIALSRHAFEVVPATSVAEANAELRRRHFSLILVDSGISAELRTFEALKAAAKQVPMMILMSGLDSLREEDLRSIGINIFLKKPFEAKEILATVLRILGMSAEPPIAQPAEARRPVSEKPLPPTPPAAGLNPHLPPLPTADAPESGEVNPAGALGEWSISKMTPGRGIEPELRGPAVFSEFDNVSPHEDVSNLSAKLPLHDNSKKGKKAFVDQEIPIRGGGPRPGSEPEFSRTEPGFMEAGRSAAEPVMPLNIGMTREEIAQVIKNTVIDYCNSHFEALARDIITAELRRLAEEKSRHLLDG